MHALILLTGFLRLRYPITEQDVKTDLSRYWATKLQDKAQGEYVACMLLRSIAESTWENYLRSMNKWALFCIKNNINWERMDVFQMETVTKFIALTMG